MTGVLVAKGDLVWMNPGVKGHRGTGVVASISDTEFAMEFPPLIGCRVMTARHIFLVQTDGTLISDFSRLPYALVKIDLHASRAQ